MSTWPGKPGTGGSVVRVTASGDVEVTGSVRRTVPVTDTPTSAGSSLKSNVIMGTRTQAVSSRAVATVLYCFAVVGVGSWSRLRRSSDAERTWTLKILQSDRLK